MGRSGGGPDDGPGNRFRVDSVKIVRMQTDEGIRYGGVEPDGIRIYDGTPFVAWQPTEVLVDFESMLLVLLSMDIRCLRKARSASTFCSSRQPTKSF